MNLRDYELGKHEIYFGENYEGDEEDCFYTEDDVADFIAQQLDRKFTQEEKDIVIEIFNMCLFDNWNINNDEEFIDFVKDRRGV